MVESPSFPSYREIVVMQVVPLRTMAYRHPSPGPLLGTHPWLLLILSLYWHCDGTQSPRELHESIGSQRADSPHSNSPKHSIISRRRSPPCNRSGWLCMACCSDCAKNQEILGSSLVDITVIMPAWTYWDIEGVVPSAERFPYAEVELAC